MLAQTTGKTASFVTYASQDFHLIDSTVLPEIRVGVEKALVDKRPSKAVTGTEYCILEMKVNVVLFLLDCKFQEMARQCALYPSFEHVPSNLTTISCEAYL
jgi:hypothetical protein